MLTRESISEQFEALGSVPSNEVLDKCIEVSIACGIDDPEEFVEQWMAFSISNLGGADPTVDYLKQMERKELNKKDNAIKKTKENVINQSFSAPYETSVTAEITSYNSYVNETNNSQILEETAYKPGAVVCTYGKLNPKIVNWTNKNNKYNFDIQIKPNKKGEILDHNALYMFDNLVDRCNVIGDYMYDVGLQLCNNYLNSKNQYIENSISEQANTTEVENKVNDDKISDSDYSELSFVNASSQDLKKCVGRIVCDADGHLNSASVMIHDSDEQALRTCHLNFNKLQTYDVYPGQICMVKGINPRGTTMYLSEIKSELPLNTPGSSEVMITDGPLQVFIASGPFTSQENLKYEPFKKIISYVKQHQPHIIILLGPFIESQHPMVIEGDLNVTFNNFVETLLLDLMEATESKSKILIVPSSKDAISGEVYPTPPYKLFNLMPKPNLLLLSDPCTINIHGLLITLTSTDIIKHMQEEELVQNVGKDVVKRCVRRIFSTRNMYPIYPPSYDVSLDSQLWSRFCEIETVPHIMVLPSDNKYYTRDIDGCVVINPGRIVHKNSGTFSRLEIHPCFDTSNWVEKMACQTVKI